MSSLPEGMCHDSPFSIALFNGDHYDTATEAVAYGAMYTCTSQVSLYGDSGLKDIEDILAMFQECIGGAGDLILCVRNRAGAWVEA